MPSLDWKTIWITGASSGIGLAIVRQIAATGAVIAISARSSGNLRELADEYSNVYAFPLDVTDEKAVAKCVIDIEAAHGPIDLAILNAGVSANSTEARPEAELFRVIYETNILGVTNAVAALVPAMSKRGAGHISWVASLAGYNGIPGSAVYNSSKAALITLAEASYFELAAKGIDLSLINPGFVRTPLTAKNRFPMPFMIEPEKAAAIIIKGLRRKKFEIAFPWQMALGAKFLRIMPYPVFFQIIRKFLLPKMPK